MFVSPNFDMEMDANANTAGERNIDGENFFKLKGYKVKALPRVNSIYGDFPYKCFLSFPLAPMKFYPSSLKYIG